MEPTAVYGAIVISGLAVLVWGILTVKMVMSVYRRHERRPFILSMPAVGLLAAVGTLASAIGFGISSGTLHVDIPPETLTLVASMGRGALLMGGVIALAYYNPSHHN